MRVCLACLSLTLLGCAAAPMPAAQAPVAPRPATVAPVVAAEPAPTCETGPAILPPCDEADGPILAQIVAALDAADIEHEACVRVKLEVLDHEPYDFTGFCAGAPALVEDIFGNTNVRMPLRMSGEGVPAETALVVGATADELAAQYGRTAWVEGADPNDRRAATRMLGRLSAGLAGTTFESVERGQLFLRFTHEGQTFIDVGGRSLVVDLGAESLVCVSRETAHIACAVLAIPDLRIERAKPRNVRLDLEEGAEVDARLFVSFGGERHALRLAISSQGERVATSQRAVGGYARDGLPWWWPTGGTTRLDRARTVVSRAPTEAEQTLATELHGLFGMSLLDASPFEGGVVYLLSMGGGGELDFQRSFSGLVVREGEAPQLVELRSGEGESEMVLTAPHDLRGRAGRFALGFFATTSVQASAEGDVRRFERFATLITRDGHLAFGPMMETGIDRSSSGTGDVLSWAGYGRTARWCGETCLALGQARAYVGEYREPDFARIHGMRPRTARDDAEDEAVFADPDAAPPTAEEQREIEAERARSREEARPREVDLGTLRGEPSFF